MTARWPLVLNGSSIQELQTGDTLNGSAFDAGTAMLFAQTAAPTGWTKSTTHNDKALRVVSGTAGSGGSVAFSTAMANTGATTLSTSQMPSHTHDVLGSYGTALSSFVYLVGADGARTYTPTATGGGGSHLHAINVAYVDVIIATKD